MRTTAFILGWLASAWAAAAPVRASFAVPPDIQGDGQTPVTISLGRAPAGVKLEATAGTLRGMQRSGEALVIDYLPPRTAAAMQVTLIARTGRAVVARATFEIAPGKETRPSAYGFFRVLGRPLISGGPDEEVALQGAAETLRVLVSAGSVRDVPQSDGKTQIRYAPPKEGYPQAVIAAITDESGDVSDWTIVPVMGEGQVEAITEPDASVRFRIGGEEFGPVRTDASGIARMVVRATPGVRQAVAVVTDRLGNVRERAVDLGIPAHPTILALCPKGADRIVLLAIDPGGTPARVSDLKVETASAQLGALAQVAPGRFEAKVLQAPPGVEEVAVLASWRNGGTGGARCVLPPRPLPPPAAPAPAPAPAPLVKRAPEPDRLSFAPRLGLAVAGPRLTGPILLLEGSWRPSSWPELSLGLQTGLTLTAGEYTTATSERFRATTWLAPALVRAAYRLELGPAAPYLALQAGAAFAGASTDSELTGASSAFHLLPSGGAALGLEWKAGPGRIAAEVSYLRGLALGFGPGEQLNAVFVSGGYRVER